MSADFYGNGTKETWRGWVVNRICDRIPKCYRRESVGIYLCGPRDRDRSLLLNRGFVNANLIAVDRDIDCIKEVRRGGGIGIQGDLLDVVDELGRKLKVAFVIADLVAGVNKYAIDLLECLQLTGDGATVIAMNLQRGRDPDATTMRRDMSDEEWAFHSSHFTWTKPLEPKQIHRGYIILASYLMDAMKASEPAMTEHLDERGKWLYPLVKDDANRRTIAKCYRHMSPSLYSYPSERGNLWFDSFVITSLFGPVDSDEVEKQLHKMDNLFKRLDPRGFGKVIKRRQRIAAALAIRTKKIPSVRGIIPSDRPGISGKA